MLARNHGRSHGGEDGPRGKLSGLEATGTHRDDRAEGREERGEDQQSRVFIGKGEADAMRRACTKRCAFYID